jgi:hypothetical protein
MRQWLYQVGCREQMVCCCAAASQRRCACICTDCSCNCSRGMLLSSKCAAC